MCFLLFLHGKRRVLLKNLKKDFRLPQRRFKNFQLSETLRERFEYFESKELFRLIDLVIRNLYRERFIDNVRGLEYN